MAIFHLTAKIISRGKGQSAIAAAAYRSGQRLTDEQTGDVKHYKARPQRILFESVFAPKDAPAWARDRQQLWNHAERAEKRKDGQLAREIEIALPHELTDQQREFLVKDFVREQFTRKGYAADVSIHAPDRNSDARNFHAHILVTMRRVDADGFATTKDRSLNTKEQLRDWRQQWERLANRHLERHGHAARIDRRTLQAQGIERTPQIHVGVAAAAMKARGLTPKSKIITAQKVSGNAAREINYPAIDKGKSRAQANDAIIIGNAARKNVRSLSEIIGAPAPSTAPRKKHHDGKIAIKVMMNRRRSQRGSERGDGLGR